MIRAPRRVLLAAALMACAPVRAADLPDSYACATATVQATAACLEILAAGGNAFDAAVAATAAIAVTEPTGSGIGGGGFWLLHRQADGFEAFVDGREFAPGAASADMYLGADGIADDHASRWGARAAAIPGEPAALDYIAARYGKLPLARDLAPAIRYARDGFPVDAKLARTIPPMLDHLSGSDARALLAPGGKPLREGELLQQPQLAQTLEALAARGAPGFYDGDIARLLVDGVRAAGGIWTREDLRRYQVIEREPLETWYRDTRIVSAPPPSAGGVGLAQIFQMLEALGFRDDGSVLSRHLLIESMRRAYRDRADYLGDPEFVQVPLARLTSRQWALDLAASVHRDRATPSRELAPSMPAHEGSNTSHLSVIDSAGNRVAATMSINLPFGSGFIAPGTGVFLNDEMDDFAASLTASNAYGLIGSAANAIAPYKRPLSSMTPTFVEGPRGVLVIGTPGGSRIITMVMLGILGWVHGLGAADIVALPRLHHQFLPDEVQFEAGALDASQQDALTRLGHTLAPQKSSYGNMHVVTWDPKSRRLEAASDPRGVGLGRVGNSLPAAPPR